MDQLHPTDKPKPLSATFPRYSSRTLLRTTAALGLGYILLLAYLHYQGDADIQRIFGGSIGLSTLNDAERVEAFRIGEKPDPNNWDNVGLLDFPVTSGPVSVSKPDIEILRTVLADRESYVWNAAKGCLPQPGIRLDFVRSDHRLSVLLCFECDILTIFLNDKLVGGEDFDKVRPALVRIARALFPDDPRIKSLPEQQVTLPAN